MSRSFIFNTLVVLALTVHVRSQYIDFFQSFTSLIQPFQTTRRADVVTKRPTNKQANKQNYQDAIFFETEDFIKQKQSNVNPYTTTRKPRRKTKTTIKPTTRSPWYQYNTESNDRKDNSNYYNNQIYNGNDNVYNYDTNTKDYNKQTTTRPVDFNNNFAVTRKSTPGPNRRTTINPLLYRPGVRPAVVDDNRPPITNKPVTRPVTLSPGNENSEAEIVIGPDEDAMSETEKRRFIEIAEQKCDEYKAMNTKKIVALPLATLHVTHGAELNVPTCAPTNIPLIIGGKVVSIKEFPHMSLVGWKNIQIEGYSWKCGGSLISEQFILTAGHCTYYDKDYNVISGPPSAVQLGSSYIDGRDSVVVGVSSVIRHPKYKARRSYYDVALIKLVTTVTFSESISPACLGVPPPVGDSIITTGWGRTEFGGDSSKELRSVSVPIWDMNECREVWGTSRKLPEGPSAASQLCAGEREGGKDTCQGDSGGPAQIQDGCTWRIVAVTSVGRSCGAAETPALYAKLPRAFIAAQVFSHVKLNVQNNNHNGNNNQHNGNNNANNGDNWGNNGFNQAGNSNQNNGNNNWGNNGSNQGGTNNQNGGRDEVNRPGNHQTVGNAWGVADNKFTNQKFGSNTDVIRPGNHQTTGNNQFANTESTNNRDELINRPGNHQTIDISNRNDAVNNYFVTSHTTGNTRQPVVSRPGNHQTIDNSNRDTNTGNNYFVTSHTSGNRGGVVSRPGNHQTIGNNYNRDIENNNRFSDSQNTENNHDGVYDTTHRQNNDNSGHNYNNNYEDNVRNTNTWAANGQNNYYNEQNNRSPQPAYSGYGAQNFDYGTTENNAYNRNNNENNNREFAVANRPWWTK